MRTTVTLDSDVEQLLRRVMRERGLSFKQALNELLRAGASSAPARRTRFRTATASMGDAAVNLDRALQLAGDLEDDELIRKVRAKK